MTEANSFIAFSLDKALKDNPEIVRQDFLAILIRNTELEEENAQLKRRLAQSASGIGEIMAEMSGDITRVEGKQG